MKKNPEQPRRLFEGLRVRPTKAKTGHFFGGQFSGKQKCPACKSVLTSLLSLDLADERIGFPDKGVDRLWLVSCLVCELSHFDFTYRLHQGDRLEILGGLIKSSPLKSVALESPMPVKLVETPDELEMLAAKLNTHHDLSEQERATFCQHTGYFAPKRVGGYPIVDIYNQVGGGPSFHNAWRTPNVTFAEAGTACSFWLRSARRKE